MIENLQAGLVSELTAWFGRAARLESAPTRLGGGHSSDSYRVVAAETPDGIPKRLVLRIMRDDKAAALECAVQAAVAASGFPAPRVFRTGDSASAFGRPFAIMAFVEGRDPAAAGLVRRLPQILAQTMFDLHAVRAGRIRATIEKDADDLDVRSLLETLRRSTRPEIARAAQWFDNELVAGERVLCHGDLHARNILMHDGRLAALLDWEVAVFGPREYDVARTELLLLLMPGVGAPHLRPLVRLLGRRAAPQFVRAYGARAALDLSTLDRCRALHALRLVALIRTEGVAADRVRALWRPFERELVRRWESLSGAPL